MVASSTAFLKAYEARSLGSTKYLIEFWMDFVVESDVYPIALGGKLLLTALKPIPIEI